MSSFSNNDVTSSVKNQQVNMPFTEEERIIIKHYRQMYGWGYVKVFSHLGTGKSWSLEGVKYLIKKIDRTGTHERVKGSGRPRSGRTEENIEEVEEFIQSQEDPDSGDWVRHDSPREIAQRLGISKNTVYRIIKHDLDLKMYHRIKGQNLSESDHEKRMVRVKRMLRTFTNKNLGKTFFSDESIFTVEGLYNAHNDVFYSPAAKKSDVDEARIHHGKSQFPKCVMVSAAISKLGKTSLYLIEQGIRIDSKYYCDGLLSQLIPEMTALSGGDFIFQQDGARSHTSKHTIAYIDDNFPRNADILLPEDWPPHSPDLNPMDYSIWSSLAKKVYKVKIRDVDHLRERLGAAWAEISQEEIDRIIGSFRKRLRACLRAGGRRFEYKLK